MAKSGSGSYQNLFAYIPVRLPVAWLISQRLALRPLTKLASQPTTGTARFISSVANWGTEAVFLFRGDCFANVRYWHLADMSIMPANVRFSNQAVLSGTLSVCTACWRSVLERLDGTQFK